MNGGGDKTSFNVGGEIFDIPVEKRDKFLSKYPDAVEVQSFVAGKDTFDIPVEKVDKFKLKFTDAKPLFEKKNLVGTSSQDGSQGLQGAQALPSSKPTRATPLDGLGGQPVFNNGYKANSANYETKLSQGEEAEFQKWLSKQNKLGNITDGDYKHYQDKGYGYNYDFRAAFKESEKSAINKTDNQPHWGDIGKKPNHPTFSDESKYSGVDGYVGGSWNGEEFTPPTNKKPSNSPLSIEQPLQAAKKKPLAQYKPINSTGEVKEFVEEDFFGGDFGASLKAMDAATPFGLGEFIDDIGRAVAGGQKQGQSVDDAILVMTKGKQISDEDLKKYMSAVEVSMNQPMSESMYNFNKEVQEKAAKNEDGQAGFWDVFSSLNAGIVPEIIVSSLSAMVNPASGAAAGGVVGGSAIVGGLPGAAASVPFALAAAGATLETVATFNELVQDELSKSKKEFTKENVRAILEDEDKLNSIRSRAAGRGLTIGVIDAITGKLGGSLGANIARKGFKGAKTAAMAATTATEALGGSGGEAAGQLVAGQEINPSEIVLEGIGEVGQAPIQLASAIGADMSTGEASAKLRQERDKVRTAAEVMNRPLYELNGEVVSKEELDNILETVTEDDIEGMDIRVTNDQEMSDKAGKVLGAASIKSQVKKAGPELSEESVNKITKAQLEINSLKENDTEVAKARTSLLKALIKQEVEGKPVQTKQETAPKKEATPKEPTVNESLTVEEKPIAEKPKEEAAPVKSIKELNIIGKDIALDKPQRKDFEEGGVGDKKYAEANLSHNENVDSVIGNLKEEGTLIDNQGYEYLVTITSQGVRVVDKLSDGSEGNSILYRKGKRNAAVAPFSNGFTFKPKETTKNIQSTPTAKETSTTQPFISTPKEPTVKESLTVEEKPVAEKSKKEKAQTAPPTDYSKKSTSELENRMSELETSKTGSKERSEFNDIEREVEKRERETVFNANLEDVPSVVDALMKKEKEMPNGFGAFMDKSDAVNSKKVAEKYLSPENISEEELKEDWKNAVMGNPDKSYADGLLLREATNEATRRGISTRALTLEVEKDFEKDGFTATEAREVIAKKLKPILEQSKTETPPTAQPFLESLGGTPVKGPSETMAEIERHENTQKGKRQDAPSKETDGDTGKATELEKAKQELKDAWKAFKDEGNNLGFADMPENKGKRLADLDERLAKALINFAREYIATVADKARVRVSEMIKAFTDAGIPITKQIANDILDIVVPIRETGKPKKKGKTSIKRYTARTIKALSGMKDKSVLEDAIKALGLKQSVVSWKKVEPISRDIVEDIFSDPETVDQKVNELYSEILDTKNKDYIDNRELSTLHSLTFHMMLDRLYTEGMNDLYVKWNAAFQEIGAGKGRFISAMQRDASPYALRNLQLRPLYEGLNKALNTETETGSTRFEEIEKIKTLVDELLSKEELIKGYEAKVKELSKALEKANSQQTFGGSVTQTSAPSVKGKARVKAGRKLFMEGLREAAGRANAGIPINDKILSGIKEMVLGLIEEGMYEASRIKKSIMKDVNEQLKGDTDAIIDIAEAIDEYFRSNEFEESRKEAMKTAFIESLENRAKSMVSGDKRAKEKGAEQVLLDSLLQKLGQEIGRDAQKGSKAYQERLKSALENLEFSDDVWKSAIASVKTWLGRQEMDAVKKAEILARLEDSASLFMENPFAKSDLRRAIRDGETEIGQSVSNIVKRHWSERNKYMETLAEKLVSELGLNAETAKKYEQAVMEEAKSYMNEKRLAAIRQALNLDKNGMRKERAAKVNQRVIDKIIEAINLGMLDDDIFRGLFAEKYGIVNLTQEDIRMMEHLNDLINIHEGTDISRRYAKELADYIETLKPWTATRVMSAIQGMTIKGMLTGLSTIAINIPVGSLYSFVTATMPTIIANPIAFKSFLSEYSKSGLSGTSRRTFLDIMKEGYSPQEDGLGSKYDERDIYGDPIDYMLRNYDRKKAWKEVSNAKSPKEAAAKFGRMVAGQYMQVLRLANFAKAFDVLLSTRGVEFDLFLKYWQEESKAAGHPLRGKFDPSVSKKFIDSVREKMAYDPATRDDIMASVDEQIAGMKARGERVGMSYRRTLIREAMIAQRNMEDYKNAKGRVASYLLMEQPTGLLSYVYDPLTKTMAIKEGDNAVAAAGKLGFNLTMGLFLRISITAAQRGMENIPVAGLALPGILYDRVPSDPINPKSDKEWRTFLNDKYDKEQMKRRLMTHASVAALAGIVAMNMFKIKDDEEEEEQEDGSFKVVKKTRIVENENRVFEVTGFSGEFFKTEQFDRPKDPRKDYYFRVRVGDKWHNAVPLRLAPHFLFPVSVLGGMSDDLKFNPNADRKKRDLLVESFDDFALAWSEMSFATIPKTAKGLYFASQKGGREGLIKVGEIVVRPARTAIYPNAYRDAYKETMFLMDKEEKLSQGLLSPITNDVPFLEDYMGESVYDAFGYPKKVTSKLIQSAEDAPVAGIIVDNYLDYAVKNKERFETDAWQKKMKYFPNVEIKGYWPSGFSYETKVKASQVYGEILRGLVDEIPESSLKEATPENTSKQIDLWLNGKLDYDGTRSGGIHNKITKEVRNRLGMDKMEEARKEEFKIKQAVSQVLNSESYNNQEISVDDLLKSLEEVTKERKRLEDELQPKKRMK